MEMIRGYALSIWRTLDPIYYLFTRLTYLGMDEDSSECVFRVRLTRYKGRTVMLKDGTEIKKNDLLVKIHLHNVKLIKDLHHIDNDFKKVVCLFHKVQASLPHVARYLEKHKDCREIKGIIGITLLDRGCQKLGFEPYIIQNKWYRLFKLSSLIPIAILSSNKEKRFFTLKPHYLMMSKTQLFNRYQSNKTS